LIYLPKQLGLWYANKAHERGVNPGEMMYFVMRKFAEDSGFKCDHPSAAHILHEKGNKNLYRCDYCGFLFYKTFDKLADKWVIKPRIEEI